MTIKEEQEETYKIILSLAKLFRSQCYLCKKKCLTGKHFVIHHRKYLPFELTYKDFKRWGKSRLDYYKYLEPIVRKNPKRFRLLHNYCHQAVSKASLWKKENRRRLCQMAMEQP